MTVSSPDGGDWRAAKRALIDERFAAASVVASVRHASPSGRYELEVLSYERNGVRSSSEGVVRHAGAAEPIAVIRRNYGHFPFAWAEGHPAGHDYLLAGEDYQGQTVVELDTGSRTDHLSDEAERGHAFCWVVPYVAPDGGVVLVEGCYWGSSYDLVAFDFSQPMQLPYRELHRWSDDLGRVDGFDEQGTFTWNIELEVRASDGKPLEDLSDEELDALLDNGRYRPGSYRTQIRRVRWRSGDPFDATEIVDVGSRDALER